MKISDDGILIAAIVVLVVFCAGDPDIIDAIVIWIMK